MITVVGNLKGGTGKSTITFNLSVKLSINSKSVQLFDLDPQATLSDVVDIRIEEEYEPVLKVCNNLDELDKQHDEILIDIGTAAIDSMYRAIQLADRIVVPVPPSQADIWSTQRFLQIINEKCEVKKPQILGLVNRADTHKGIRETGETEDALNMLPDIDLIQTRLYQRTSYRRSFSEGLAVFELEPKGKAAAEVNKLSSILYPNI
ncbi:MAG: AAA family ATPase [Gammaproteobacteria bacterium]|nr:AAA family ATPase [Gammaproteobacteria bacterium]